MKYLTSCLLVGVLLAFAAGAALATDYYVATNGSDSWPGTSSQPWATIQHAVDTIAPGDTIIVKPGAYAGGRIRYAGTSGGVKTLKAETPLTVVINAKSSVCRKDSNIELDADDYWGPVSYWTLEGLEVTNSAKSGICVLNADHFTLRNCKCHHNGAHDYGNDGMYCVAPYALIENNQFYSNGEHGLYLGQGNMDYVVLRNNVAHDNYNMGFHNNGDWGAPFDDDGILDNWLIEKNISYGNQNSHGMDADGMQLSVIRNNLIYDNGNNGIMFTGIGGSCGSRNNKVYNNTVIQQSGGSYCFNIYLDWPPDMGNPVGNKLKNNIFYHYGNQTMCIDSLGFPNFESDYNVVMAYFYIDDGATQETLAQWRTRGYDTHSVQASDTALFVNPSGKDFHLKAGSPAINAGTNLSPDVTDDLEGNSRPQGGAYDIGCYESGGGPADLVITTTGLPGGTVGVAYSQTVEATGGVTPYSWSVVSGSLPAGLSLGSSTGTISGTPTSSGTSNFTVRVTDSQTPTPATNDKALSIPIDPASSEPTYKHTSSDTESTTTSTTYQAKLTLQWTPTIADDYAIIGSAEYDATNYGASWVRMTVDGAVQAESCGRVRDVDCWPFAVQKVMNLSAAQHTITIDYRSDGSRITAKIRRARIVAIRKAALTWSTNAADGTYSLTTSPADYVTLNFTPSSAGDYLLIWTAELQGYYGQSCRVRAMLNSSIKDEAKCFASGSDFACFASFAVANLAASQETLAVQAYQPTSGGAQIRRCRVTAIRLTGSRFADYAYASDDNESTTTSTSFVEKLSKSWTSGSTGNWLLLGSARTSLSSGNYSTETRWQYNDSATVATQELAVHEDANEVMCNNGIGVINVTGGSRKVDLDYRLVYSGATAKIKYAHITVLPLD